MTPDSLTTAARAAGYALAGEPHDAGDRETTAASAPLRLPIPDGLELKPIYTNWWRDLLALRSLRAPA